MRQVLADHLLTVTELADSSRLGEDDLQAARKLLLDAVGCALGARQASGVQPLLRHAREQGGVPQATVLGFDSRLPMARAASMNSVLIHALDFDDVHSLGMPLHLNSVIVPVILAVGEACKASGRAALAAMIRGIEVAGRLSVGCCSHQRGPGFLPTTLIGGFGAVVAAAELLSLTRRQMLHALGIQYARCSGNRQALLEHTLTKRLQPGFAVETAIDSALLAARGMTGPHHWIEGQAGFFQLYMNGQVPSPEAFDAPSVTGHVHAVSLKRYPSCGACHHVQIAIERLLQKNLVRRDEIESVSLFNCDPGHLVTGPFTPGAHPGVSAQFSAEWAVAHTLVRGPACLADYDDKAVANDSEVIEFANAIQHIDPPPSVPLPEPGSQGVVVCTTGGETWIEVQARSRTFPPGGMPWDEVAEKVGHCARFGGCEDTQKIEAVIDRVGQFDGDASIPALLAAIDDVFNQPDLDSVKPARLDGKGLRE